MDVWFFEKINQFTQKWPGLDALAVFLSDKLGYLLIFFIILFLIKDFKKHGKLFLQIIASSVLSRLIVAEIVKYIVRRPRPFEGYDVNLIIAPQGDFSFPSGHASLYFAISTAIFFHNKKAGIICLVVSSLMGISRIFCGVHWPSDILAGATIGILSAWLVQIILKRISKQKTPQ